MYAITSNSAFFVIFDTKEEAEKALNTYFTQEDIKRFELKIERRD